MKGMLKMGVRNLLRNRRRSMLTILSVAIGCAGAIFIFGYGIRFERYLRTAQQYLLHSGHLAIYKEKGLRKHLADPQVYDFSAEEQARVAALLKSDPDVELFTPYLLSAGLISNGCKTEPYRVIGADPRTEKWIYTHPQVLSANPELVRMNGTGFWEYPQLEAPVMLSKGLAALIHKTRVYGEAAKTGSGAAEPAATAPATAEGAAPAPLDCNAPDIDQQVARDSSVQLLSASFAGDFAAIDAEVVGTYTTGFSASEDNTLMMPLAALQKLHDTDAITYTAVFLKDPSRVAAKAKAIQEKLEAQGIKTTLYVWDDPQTSPNYTSVVPMLQQIYVIIMMIMATIVGFSIINTMTMSIVERSRELGTLRAIGFTPPKVMRLLLAEVSILALVGVGAGLSLGMAGAATINALNVRFQAPGIADTIQFMVKPNLLVCLGVGTIIFLVALAAAWLAARRRLREKIVGLLYAGTT